METRDRIRGCLIGGAAGDALGYAVEFMSEKEIRSAFGEKGITGYKRDEKTYKALISDDTQMSLFTANGILFWETRGMLRGIAGSADKYTPSTTAKAVAASCGLLRSDLRADT